MNDRMLRTTFAAIVALIALVSCPLPTATVSGDGTAVPPEEPAAVAPTLVNDAERGLVVYVSETGQRFDVVSEESDGSPAVCVEAFALAPAPPDAAGPADRGIVFGRRADGLAGIWIIRADGTVTGAGLEDGDVTTSTLPGALERNGYVGTRFGWTYHVTGWATDGTRTIAVGYAENELGFRHGPWNVEPGTTLGVYWTIRRRPGDPRVFVSRARIIGTLDFHRPPHDRWPPGLPWHARRRFLDLKLFLRGLFDAYLTMVDDDGASWDAALQLFVVKGTDQDGQRATATIDPYGRIGITPDVVTDTPDLSVVALEAPGEPVRIQDAWPLGATIANLGGVDIADAVVSFRLSDDATFDASDPSIGEAATGPILAGASVEVSCPTTVSISQPGTHWVFALVDPSNTLAEIDENNNRLGAPVPVRYPRLIIDTYPATTGPSSVRTFLSLFDSAGDPTLDTNPTLWNNDIPPWSVDHAVAIAEADSGNTLDDRYARIDYDRPSQGLAPGVYYVRARAPLSTLSGPYAIRVLLAPDEDYAGRQFSSYNTADTPYEVDNNPTSGGVPTRPVVIAAGASTGLNRYISPGDVDWFTITLP
jgi:hypothetical protein